MTDDRLIMAMMSPDLALAAVARRIFAKRHDGDYQPAEPPHCSECFEGCDKCIYKPMALVVDKRKP